MDQCKHCTSRGDINRCEATDCSIHETWYVRMLKWAAANPDGDLKDTTFNAQVKAGENAVLRNLEKQGM